MVPSRILDLIDRLMWSKIIWSRTKPKSTSAVDRELDSSDVLADHRKDLSPQSVMLLFSVVDSVGVGILPVVGDRESPFAVAQSKIASHVHRQQPRELQRGDASKALMEHRDIHRSLVGIIGRA
jgi:hypothetical protein